MRLVVDIGNSRLKWAWAEDGGLRGSSSGALRLPDTDILLDRCWSGLDAPDTVLVANVAGPEVSESLRRWTSENWGLEPEFLASADRFQKITNEYLDPEQLGVDRWAAAVGARSLAEGDLCIVDCGTAVTVDALTRDHRFLGGVIFPGVELVRRSLLCGTSGIGQSTSELAHFIGNDTARCVASGSVYGVCGAVDRFIEEMHHVMQEPTVIMTGGSAQILIPFLDHAASYEPDLVLIGLAHTLS